MSASWENWAPTWSDVEAADPNRDPWWESAPEPDWDTISKECAADEFVDLLVRLRGEHKLPATVACHLAFFAARAGVGGLAPTLGLPPGKPSGMYSSHWDNVLGQGLDTIDYYNLPLGLRNKYDSTRHWGDTPVRPPHEVLEEEYARNSEKLDAALKAARENDEVHQLFQDQCEMAGFGK